MENKQVIQSLERLKLNNDYLLLCDYLKNIKSIIDKDIFREDIKHCDKELLINRSNTIKLFIDLPDDLLKQFN